MPNAKHKQKLTKTLVERLTPGTIEYMVWDLQVQSFFVRVQPTGSKTFGVFYRDERGKQRKRSLGSASNLTVAEAREKARCVLADISRGYDQFLAQQRRREVPTLREFWQVYWKQHATHQKAASSRKEDKSLWRNRIEPCFGNSNIDEISRSDVRTWHSKEDVHLAAANRSLALLSKILSFAIEHDIIERNPCSRIAKFHEQPRRTFLSQTQLRAFLSALESDHDRGAAVMVELLLLTCTRRGEALKATWTEFDLTKGLWRVPSSHIKGGVRQNLTIKRGLSPGVVNLLSEWKSKAGDDEYYVFPSQKTPGRPRYDIKAFWNRVRKRAGLDGVRLHDLRHTFASLALQNGMSLWEIGEELGHRSVATTKRYAHLDPNNKNTVAAAVSDSIKGLRPSQ